MRVLMLGIKEYPYGSSAKYEKFAGGGTARYVINLSEYLAKQGVIIDLITRKMPLQKSFEEINGINIYRVLWIKSKYLRLPSFSIFSFLKAFMVIRKVDLIHAHGSFDAITGLILSRIFRKKIIVTPHGLTSFQAGQKYIKVATYLTRCIEKLGFKHTDEIIYLSENEKTLVESQLKIRPESYKIINMGIEPLNIKKTKSDTFNVLFIGRLVPIKGLDKFILSYLFLPDDIKKQIRYYLIGDGFYKKQLQRLINQNNLSKSIIMPGFTKEINKYLSIASLFIIPSSGGEGLPVALLEAMSAGIPSLISNFTPPFKCRSVILMDDNSPQTIANNIINLYKDNLLLSNLSNQAIREFKKYYSVESSSIRYLSAYNEII